VSVCPPSLEELIGHFVLQILITLSLPCFNPSFSSSFLSLSDLFYTNSFLYLSRPPSLPLLPSHVRSESPTCGRRTGTVIRVLLLHHACRHGVSELFLHAGIGWRTHKHCPGSCTSLQPGRELSLIDLEGTCIGVIILGGGTGSTRI
jgi:hypothetical protein